MSKILLGFGYLTWMICNIAVVYGIGKGAVYLINKESFGEFIMDLAFGMIVLFCIVLLSLLSFLLITMLFGSKEMKEKIENNKFI